MLRASGHSALVSSRVREATPHTQNSHTRSLKTRVRIEMTRDREHSSAELKGEMYDDHPTRIYLVKTPSSKRL